MADRVEIKEDKLFLRVCPLIFLNLFRFSLSNISENMNIDSDLLLVEKVKDGDQKAFAELVAIHKRRIFGIILKMVRNLEDVQDLSQETFVRVYKGLKDFRGESSFKTWITKIAINLCINFNRKRNLKSFVCIFDLSQPFMWRSIFKKRIMSKPQGFRPTDY